MLRPSNTGAATSALFEMKKVFFILMIKLLRLSLLDKQLRKRSSRYIHLHQQHRYLPQRYILLDIQLHMNRKRYKYLKFYVA